MDNTWDEELENLDWESIDREVEKLGEEEWARDELHSYFSQDCFDYKRGYIRKFMKTYPAIYDTRLIDSATEQMIESHEAGVELDMADAIRFVENEKPTPVSELVEMLKDAGATDEKVFDMLAEPFGDGKRGTKKNPIAKKKAEKLTRYADMLARNKDILILGIPVFDRESDWTMAKLAFFSENFTPGEKYLIQQMIETADKPSMEEEHGVAVAYFQIFNIWSDFK